jgi:UDP-N-acetylmuramate: L-alanyl-gamma-D-glutamyl-meso-diaminopimelate ligase
VNHSTVFPPEPGVAVSVEDPAAQIAAGLAAFRGVKRRQEVRGEAGGVTVIDDFAHHPTAVERTLAGLRGSYPGARLLVAFEPRANPSRRSLPPAEYARSFHDASRVWLLRPAPTDRVPEAERLDVDRLAREVAAEGVPAEACATVDAIVEGVRAAARPGDVVVAMSNGAFGGIWPRLLDALR